ncbi:hypothetical protein FA95DRAFT_1503543, partial [Auriscalpium vulgare]
EPVFVVRGILTAYDLPPVRDKKQLGHFAYARQQVEIQGFGSATFERAANGIFSIHQQMSARFGKSELNPLDLKQNGEDYCLQFSNRYFTNKTQAGNMKSIGFSAQVDPEDILKNAPPQFVHLEENEVLYYEQIKNENKSQPVYKRLNPAEFRPGHVVEIQCTFASVPLSGSTSKHKMLCQLRAIALLERQLCEVYLSTVLGGLF